MEDLINKGEGCMNKDVIKDYLGGEMVDNINGSHLSIMGMEDKLIWKENANGKFTMKSTYYLQISRLRRESGESSGCKLNKRVWKRIFGSITYLMLLKLLSGKQ